ncbi:DNA methyltransferase [Actinomycetes bacterium M1A6_2h]
MGPDFFDRATTTTKLGEFAHFWATQRIQVWRATGERATEKKYAQSFWSDLLRCFGIIPERINLFERDAQRASTGSHGWIDFFMTGVAIGEAKSLDVDLDAAVEQINDYLRGGVRQSEYPRYAVVTNFATIRIIRLDGTEPETRFPLEEIAEHYDQLRFLVGEDTITGREQEEASTTAAQLMASLYTSILGEDIDAPVGDDAAALEDEEAEDGRVETTAVLMTRLLFLLYGDDAGLWEKDLFYRWVHDETTPASLSAQLSDLFRVLNTPTSRRSKNLPELLARFPYVNGGIFAEHVFIDYFTPETREALLAACRFQWNRISVSVFGAMFQLVKSKEARRVAGEHYTSETNILKTIGPLFLEDYQAKADRLIRNKSTRPKDFDALIEEMAGNIYLDPACGGGNFLNVAYALLRDIETSLLVEKQHRGGEFTGMLDVTLGQKLTIDRFYGFEINWWPAKIAETAMFLVDHQANQRLAQAIGQAPDRLPITITAHISHGNALTLDWAEVLPEPAGQTFIFGNPPFIGQYTKTAEQTADMKRVWGKDYDGYLDYVTAWHAKALDLYRDRRGEFAYVTTNSITQGQPVPALFAPIYRAGFDIKFAHRTFAWDSQAPGKAAVHCVIIGFTRDKQHPQRLWDYPTPQGEAVEKTPRRGINAYLVDGPELLVTKRTRPLSPLLPPVAYGSKPADGGFLAPKPGVDPSEGDPIAARYVRRFVGAKELIHDTERWCLWLTELEPTDVSRSAVLREQLNQVRQFRLASSKAQTQEQAATPSMFAEIRQPEVAYLAIPAHVGESRSYFLSQRFEPDVICGNANFFAPDPDGLLFGLISSSMFMAWQRTVGGKLESRLRFSNTVVWNNFPVPELDDKQRAQIITGGEGVLAARALHPDRSLAEHYHPLAMDPPLLKAHSALDRAVDTALGAAKKLTTEEQRLEVLFRNYQDLTS